jgi:hypothetical protein
MPVHQAYREQVVEEVGLKLHIGEVMIIVPKVIEIDLFVRCRRQAFKSVLAIVELLLPDCDGGLGVAEDAPNTLPTYEAGSATR